MKVKITEQRGIDWYREKIANVPKYRSLGWQTKVYTMSPRQVIAIYKKFKTDGLFDKRYKEVKKAIEESEKYHQITIFEYMEDKKNE